MASRLKTSFRGAALAALLLGVSAPAVSAQDAGPKLSAGPAAAAYSVIAGGQAKVSGAGLQPGQAVSLTSSALGGAALGGGLADAEGKFEAVVTVPAGTAPGDYPVQAALSNPAGAAQLTLHVSPYLEFSGQEAFDLFGRKTSRGLYQTAYSPKTGKLFATSAVGRPPVKESELLRLNPETLEVEARVTPAEAPARPDGSAWGLYALYGLGLDDANGNIWTTNTRQDTIAVYRQSDLSLVKQFPPGAVTHARDVAVDEERGRVYISTARGASTLEVFDAKTLEHVGTVALVSKTEGKEFVPMSLELDPVNDRLYTVSMPSDEWAAVDLPTSEVAYVGPVPGAKGASGVAFDPQTNRLYVASQQSDNLVILDTTTNAVVADVPVGATPLNAAFAPTTRLSYVATRGAGTIAILNAEGEIPGTLPDGVHANPVAEDGLGNVYTTDRAINDEDPAGDMVRRISPKAASR